MTDEYYAIACRPAIPGARGAIITTVCLSGEFDLGASAALRAAILRAVVAGTCTRIEIDLAQVGFIDSETVRVLLEGYTAASSQGLSYRLINAHGVVRRVLDVMGLTTLIRLDEPIT